MEKKIFDFRCPIDNALFCKCTIESNIQVKCRKCKLFYIFDKGKVSSLGIKDNNLINERMMQNALDTRR